MIIQTEQTVSSSKREGRSVGIDLGLDSFAVDSDGAVIENPRFYEHSLGRIKKIQRSLARKQRFSKNWKKAKGKLEKVYDHVTNQKNDFLHKLSRQYVDTYATICVEDLNIKYLKENGKPRGLRRSKSTVRRGDDFILTSRTRLKVLVRTSFKSIPETHPRCVRTAEAS